MIETKNLCIAYENKIVIEDFSFSVEEGQMVSIIGPNGSGKSTLLKAISRFLKKKSGVVYLEKEDMDLMNIKKVAQKMSTLSQHNKSPEDLVVKELIYYGRMPHKKWLERRNGEDEKIINWAINHTSLQGYENKKVMELSGGERQRVWIAMALAQKPKILLLDEPTTYLDICHQLEVMELIKELNKSLNLTVIMVLHDLSQAAKYSNKIVVIKDGNLVVEGNPHRVLTEELIKEVYNVETCIRKDILNGEFMIHPIGVCKGCEKRCNHEKF
ncbi:ABC transporter family protein [Clostridium argentinense CDC 2741]|uniref:ABC transporter family protein n=1 Tax=Clostridium argentinense CDC 2741 TaxID=1418104 RepID=A0A0C1QTS6_9CLOT|nr:ABC transporter ATP-binding protein [Clostridium argentinense]ARC83867.1 iron ABC transporter ATP-binding protein [Clostridium argentinense]KIE44387.1 ABC transporter family protein [Clostridium argentinense CDC 2741]NFF39775.1 ABC transporter ATP-binding protein [Clostridium argentinense]NFP49775.1 ABC transporter ATP-binding protein [Clostridium argentinense]NFP72176.1 ABC transporter ATP-binding protein [Clostridium argentinense]